MSADYLEATFDSELVIGLVSPCGAESDQVIKMLTERLQSAGYQVVTIKISKDVIPVISKPPDSGGDHYKRISDLMNAGNDARKKTGDNSILALGAATEISAKRNGQKSPLAKTAFVIDSLKRPEEVARLRAIYSSGFILVGVHAPQDRRLKHLMDLQIPKGHAEELIQRDSDEASDKHGQRVNDTFHLADFFVRVAESTDCLRADTARIVDLWFGDPFVTPTFDEHAMFMAFASGLRSADMSRQVGAVVARDSQILSAGANECPCPGGGQYWPHRLEDKHIGDDSNGRDYMRPDGDSNRAEQVRIIGRIIKDGKDKYGLDPAKLEELLRASSIRDLTEYGRVVHAEMEALLSCARNGISTVGATLYSTTFPCHNCAKHIIDAGIERVVYVEPYPKSKALEFHDDAIHTGDDRPNRKKGDKRVWFTPFLGVGPRRFFDLFSMTLGSTSKSPRKDKETGKVHPWGIQKTRLRVQMNPASYLELEAQACMLFGELKNGGAKEEANERTRTESSGDGGDATGAAATRLDAEHSALQQPARKSDATARSKK